MPLWMRECQYVEVHAKRLASRRPVDDPEKYGEWREDAAPENLRALDLYGRYLIGQYAGLGKALDLGAVRAALEIDGVDREEWPEMTARLLQVHAGVVESLPD